MTLVVLMLLGAWIGAAALFSFGVAPGAFAVIASRETAGAMVQRTLAIVNIAGFLIGAFALAASWSYRKDPRPLWLRIRIGILAVMIVSTGIGHWVIAARLRKLREIMGLPIDLVPPTDPIRIAFNQLHGYSVTALGLAMLAALAAWLLIAVRTRIPSSNER
jgi:hypothetical protein